VVAVARPEDRTAASVDVGRRDEERAVEVAEVVVGEELAELLLEPVDGEDAAREVAGAAELLAVGPTDERAEREPRLLAPPLEPGPEPVDHVVGAVTLEVEPADQRPGRRADEDVDVDVELFERTEHAEMR